MSAPPHAKERPWWRRRRKARSPKSPWVRAGLVLLGSGTLVIGAFWLVASLGLINPCDAAGRPEIVCRTPPRSLIWLQFAVGIAGSAAAFVTGGLMLWAAFRARASHRLKPITLARTVLAGLWTIVYLIGLALV